MLSPFDWNLGAKGAFIFAATGACCTIYCIFRLPETKHRSYGELDILFEKRVPAWRFKSTKVDRKSSRSDCEELEECLADDQNSLSRGLNLGNRPWRSRKTYLRRTGWCEEFEFFELIAKSSQNWETRSVYTVGLTCLDDEGYVRERTVQLHTASF